MLLFLFHLLFSVASATEPLPSLEKLSADWSYTFYNSTEVLSAPNPKFNALKIEVRRANDGRDYQVRQSGTENWFQLKAEQISQHHPAASSLHVSTTSLPPLSIENGPEVSGIPNIFLIRPPLAEFEVISTPRKISDFLVMELTPKENFKAVYPNLRLWVNAESLRLEKIDFLSMDRRAMLFRLVISHDSLGSKILTALDPILYSIKLKISTPEDSSKISEYENLAPKAAPGKDRKRISSLQIFSWLLTLSTAAMILVSYIKMPQLLTKPSFVFLIFFHIHFQYGAALYSNTIELFLPEIKLFLAALFLYPLMWLVISILSFRQIANETYLELQSFRDRIENYLPLLFTTVVSLSAVLILILFWYLHHVPLKETGLYALFFDQDFSVSTREKGLKLLPSNSLKYIYSFAAATICPIIGILASFIIRAGLRNLKKYGFQSVISLLAIFVCFVFLSIYGARILGAMLGITIVFANYLISRRSKMVFVIPILGLGLLMVPTCFSLFYDAAHRSQGLVLNYLNMLERAFVRPFIDSVWYLDHYFLHGPVGLFGALPKIAPFFGEEPINLLQLVGLNYTHSIKSVSANTPFMILYLSSLGPWILFPLLVIPVILDSLILLVRNLPPPYKTAAIAGVGIAATNLSGTFFTTILFTYGALTIPLFLLMMAAFLARKSRDQ